MAIRRPRLVEVDFIFITNVPGARHQNRVTVHASLLRKKLYLSFSIGGPAERRETLPASLVDAIRFGLEYAAEHTRAQDLMEEPLEEEGKNERE